ncbi:hypothetical protein [Corynebacterium diphtheriae]|uniref:hypothetical protein n=1 Tax=Corynebacterium diphtheriae TaxID=1717 RepID=UPI000D07244A|nr:hypothetical protein [Corynebacterium diphtheriae]PSA79170.1 hypothetical protein BT094_06295 [Corynebacterium diphtheriae]
MSILNILDRVPTRWDGRKIEWGDWEPAPIVCGSVSNACDSCGCTSGGIVRKGHVEQAEERDGNVVPLHSKAKTHLILFRCTGCAATSVFDGAQFWELDEQDYGPKGSYEQMEVIE